MSDQFRSNPIGSDQIRSNRIKSDQVRSDGIVGQRSASYWHVLVNITSNDLSGLGRYFGDIMVASLDACCCGLMSDFVRDTDI